MNWFSLNTARGLCLPNRENFFQWYITVTIRPSFPSLTCSGRPLNRTFLLNAHDELLLILTHRPALPCWSRHCCNKQPLQFFFFFTKYGNPIYLKTWHGVSSSCNVEDHQFYQVNSQACRHFTDFTYTPLCCKFFHAVLSHLAVRTRSISTITFFGVHLYRSLGSKLRPYTNISVAPGTHLHDLLGRF